MEEVQGYFSRSTVYVDKDNFLYLVDKVKDNRKYMRCHITKCRGRIILYENHEYTRTHEHNHLPSEEKVLKCKFRQRLRQCAMQSTAPLKKVFLHVRNERKDTNVPMGRYRTFKQLMIRARRKGVKITNINHDHCYWADPVEVTNALLWSTIYHDHDYWLQPEIHCDHDYGPELPYLPFDHDYFNTTKLM